MENIENQIIGPLEYIQTIEDEEFFELYDNSYQVIESMCFLASLDVELNNQVKKKRGLT
jgi:hypothetical protein